MDLCPPSTPPIAHGLRYRLSRGQANCFAFSLCKADGMNRWQIQNIKAHCCDVAKPRAQSRNVPGALRRSCTSAETFHTTRQSAPSPDRRQRPVPSHTACPGSHRGCEWSARQGLCFARMQPQPRDSSLAHEVVPSHKPSLADPNLWLDPRPIVTARSAKYVHGDVYIGFRALG